MKLETGGIVFTLETGTFSMKRGKQSAADLSVVRTISDARPQAPGHLNAAQSELWQSIVNRLPQDWFGRETLPILEAHVRHITTHRFISDAVDQFTTDWLAAEGGVERLQKLTQMREREARGMVATARALRLTKSAQIRPEKAGRALRDNPGGSRPWEGYEKTQRTTK